MIKTVGTNAIADIHLNDHISPWTEDYSCTDNLIRWSLIVLTWIGNLVLILYKVCGGHTSCHPLPVLFLIFGHIIHPNIFQIMTLHIIFCFHITHFVQFITVCYLRLGADNVVDILSHGPLICN